MIASALRYGCQSQMIMRCLLALATGISLATAFKDTSPFFLFSTSELLTSSPNLISASSLHDIITPQLRTCPSDTYIIVSQPGVNAADYQPRGATPTLRRLIVGGADEQIRSSLVVQDVKGTLSAKELSALVQTECGARHIEVDASTGTPSIPNDAEPRVIDIDFPAPEADSRRSETLAEHDAFLASVIDLLPSKKYTVVYTTSPSNTVTATGNAEPGSYQLDSIFQTPLHTDLKRDLSSHKRREQENITLPDGPLFERYQYFSPGLFMGLLTSFLLLMILYVAVTGVSSLQISYAAFDKETGPSVQKNKAQ